MQVSILGLFNCYFLASDQCILLLLQAHWNCKTALLLLCRVVLSCKVLAMLQATGVLLLLCFFFGDTSGNVGCTTICILTENVLRPQPRLRFVMCCSHTAS